MRSSDDAGAMGASAAGAGAGAVLVALAGGGAIGRAVDATTGFETTAADVDGFLFTAAASCENRDFWSPFRAPPRSLNAVFVFTDSGDSGRRAPEDRALSCTR